MTEKFKFVGAKHLLDIKLYKKTTVIKTVKTTEKMTMRNIKMTVKVMKIIALTKTALRKTIKMTNRKYS